MGDAGLFMYDIEPVYEAGDVLMYTNDENQISLYRLTSTWWIDDNTEEYSCMLVDTEVPYHDIIFGRYLNITAKELRSYEVVFDKRGKSMNPAAAITPAYVEMRDVGLYDLEALQKQIDAANAIMVQQEARVFPIPNKPEGLESPIARKVREELEEQKKEPSYTELIKELFSADISSGLSMMREEHERIKNLQYKINELYSSTGKPPFKVAGEHTHEWKQYTGLTKSYMYCDKDGCQETKDNA